MSAWGYAIGAAAMAGGGLLLVHAWTPKRRIGRHETNPAPLRAEAGADATYAAELAVMRTEIEETGPMPEPNYIRSGEYQLVERPPGDTQAWLIQECLTEQHAPAEPVDGDRDVPAAAEPAPWLLTALPDEPTPLAPGPVPQLPDDLDPSTIGWNRDEYLQRLRRYELELLEQATGERAA